MSNALDLKQIERKAFRSTHQDGLLDIYLGGIVVALAITMYRPAGGYTPNNILIMLLLYTVIGGLFWVGKKFVTVPRMGQVRFGPMRKQKKKLMAIILVIIVIIQALFVGLTAVSRANPGFGVRLFGNLNADQGSYLVAAIVAFFIGPPMLLIAYFIDFLRGYYIAILMALAASLMFLINNPMYPIVIGALIILPGLVLFFSFLKKYPLPQGGGPVK
jgi:hypothetical protein